MRTFDQFLAGDVNEFGPAERPPKIVVLKDERKRRKLPGFSMRPETFSVLVIFAGLLLAATLAAGFSLARHLDDQLPTASTELPAASAAPPSAPVAAPEPPRSQPHITSVEQQRLLADFETLWLLSHPPTAAAALSAAPAPIPDTPDTTPPRRKAATHATASTPLVAQGRGMVIFHAQPPEPPRYLPDATRWPLHAGPPRSF